MTHRTMSEHSTSELRPAPVNAVHYTSLKHGDMHEKACNCIVVISRMTF